MSDNYRFLFPVGHGGFDIEDIDGTRIVFDCGSKPIYLLHNCISYYKDFIKERGGHDVIDYLFLSHFDQDHVNGLGILSKYFKIKNIIVPYIPKGYRVIYNFITGFAVTSFYNLMSRNSGLSEARILGSTRIEANPNIYQSVKSLHGRWEWIYKSIFSRQQWDLLKGCLAGCGVISDNDNYDDEGYFSDERDYPYTQAAWEEQIADVEHSWNSDRTRCSEEKTEGISIEDFDIDSYKGHVWFDEESIKKVNKAIGKIAGGCSRESFAKNENGLLMLSKKQGLKQVSTENFYSGILNFWYNPFPSQCSACLYTGDMRFDVKSCSVILDFLKMAKEPLLLFQIPHHGSSHNSSYDCLWPFPTEYFFWHDRNYNRINKNIPHDYYSSGKFLLIDTIRYLECFIMF